MRHISSFYPTNIHAGDAAPERLDVPQLLYHTLRKNKGIFWGVEEGGNVALEESNRV
jgi:hypothetical protein